MTAIRQWLDQERSLWVAWLMLVAATLVVGGVFVPFGAEACVGVAVYCAYLLLLIRVLRGSQSSNDPRSRLFGRRLGAWGYIWRSYVVLQVAVLPLIWATASVSEADARHPPQWVSWLALLGLPPVVTWLGFGRDRIAYLKRVFTRHGGDAV